MVTGKFNIGLSKSNSGTECVWSPTEYDFNTEHVIVISYENIGDANALNQVSNLWIDPTTTTQPTATLSQNNPTTSITRDHLDGIKLLQASSASTPLVIIDEIRVANNWGEAIGAASTYVALPTVESRQAFNSTSNPTVANLVAVGSNLKWYTTSTGGSVLATSAPLTYNNYYVSQTVNGNESPRVGTQVFVGDTALKTLPLHENFAVYNVSDKLILMNNGVSAAVATNNGVGLGSWSITPSSNIIDDVTIAASPSWATSILPVSSGNALTYVGSGIDPELKFTDTTSGSLFSSFVFTAADTTNIVASTTSDPNYSTPTGFYSFLGESINSGTGSVSAEYASSIMFRKNMISGKFNLGLSKSNSNTECIWSPTEYDFNTEHVIVISYENIGITNSLNQISSIWIDPTTTAQPAATLTQNSPVTPISRSHLDRIKLVQASSSSTPLIIIDEIRVANNWGEAIGGASTFAPLPTVEARQAFNSNTNPTVADLVAIGTNLKWYTASTGGVELATATPLTYAKYYVSQTNNGIESPRVGTEVFVGDIALKTLPFYESFGDYNIEDKLVLMNNNSNAVLTTNNGVGLGSWSISPSSNITDDVTIVASPVWDILPVATGNAISFAGSGIDPELKFTNTTSGNLFSSFVFNVADAPSIVASTTTDPNYSTPTGFYGFVSETVDPVSGIVTTGYASDVMFRKNMVTGKFNLGLSKSNSGTECVWSPTEYNFNSQHVIVISYENIGDVDTLNQVSKLWVDPLSAFTSPTLSQNNPTTPVGRDNLDRIKLLQASSSSTPLLVIDEIRVGTNFADAYLETTLGTNNVMNVSEFKMYPNPVTNGKLFIVSSTDLEKQVIIYNTLGQEVLKTTTTTEAINVSNLSKGTYFVKITEAGNTATKKLIVQ
jgi:phage gp36-like protein